MFLRPRASVRCATPQERTGQCTQLYRHLPNLVTSTGSILGNLTAIGTEYESFPRGPHAEVGIIRPYERPTATAGYAHRLLNGTFREQWLADIKTQHYQLDLAIDQ